MNYRKCQDSYDVQPSALALNHALQLVHQRAAADATSCTSCMTWCPELLPPVVTPSLLIPPSYLTSRTENNYDSSSRDGALLIEEDVGWKKTLAGKTRDAWRPRHCCNRSRLQNNFKPTLKFSFHCKHLASGASEALKCTTCLIMKPRGLS